MKARIICWLILIGASATYGQGNTFNWTKHTPQSSTPTLSNGLIFYDATCPCFKAYENGTLKTLISAGTLTGSGTSGQIAKWSGTSSLTGFSIGTGVETALGVNTGSAGAFVVNGGVLGTPSSGTLTNATGLPISTGVSGLGSGVATLLGTFSWTNFNSAITGTAPYWSLASGGTFTASPTLAMAGFDVNFLNGNALFGPTGATITASTKMDVRGNGTGSSDWSLRLANSANASRFQFTNDAKMEIGSAATKPYISTSDNTVSQSPTGNNLFFRGLGNFPFLFNASTLSGGSSKNIIRVDGGTITNTSGDSYSSVVDILSLVGSGAGTATLRRFYAAGSTTLTTGSHSYSSFTHGTTVTSSSGTPTVISFNSIPEYNLTGTSAGTLIGFRHSPTRTSINGAPEYAFIADGGLSGFGTLTPTARIQSIGTGNTTAINLLLESNDGTDRWAWQDNGVLLLAGSAGTLGQVPTSQGAGAAPIWSSGFWPLSGTGALTGPVEIEGSGTRNISLGTSGSTLNDFNINAVTSDWRVTDFLLTINGDSGSSGDVLTADGLGSATWAAPSGSISGLTTNRIPYATSATTLGDDSALTWDATNDAITIGNARLHTKGGAENLFLGASAGNFTLSGTKNTAIGGETGESLTSGGANTLVGYFTGNALTTTFSNTFVGSQVGFQTTTGADNVIIGRDAMSSTTSAGSDNVAVGSLTLFSASFSGTRNVALGFRALEDVTSGSNNIGIGYLSGNTLTTGSNNIIIHTNTGELTSASASGALNIAGAIWGNGNTANGSTISSGNIGFFANTWGTSAAKVISIGNGTAPSTSITDGIQIYAEDVAASSELKVRDEAGNVTTLSPHNFSLLSAPSEPGAWTYYSEYTNPDTGKREAVNVDMMAVIREVERLSQKKFIVKKSLKK